MDQIPGGRFRVVVRNRERYGDDGRTMRHYLSGVGREAGARNRLFVSESLLAPRICDGSRDCLPGICVSYAGLYGGIFHHSGYERCFPEGSRTERYERGGEAGEALSRRGDAARGLLREV